jgi:hypothetical protein
MEEKLAKWIFGVVGSSYVMIVSLVLAFVLITKENAFQDPLLIKSLIMLVVYFFSLWLIHFSNSKSGYVKLKMWLSSLTIHIGIMSYIVYIFESSAAFAIMVPEICVLVLMLIGIYIIWSKARASAI